MMVKRPTLRGVVHRTADAKIRALEESVKTAATKLTSCYADYKKYRQQAEALEAECERLREALRPFVTWWQESGGDESALDDTFFACTFPVRPFCEAAKVLKGDDREQG